MNRWFIFWVMWLMTSSWSYAKPESTCYFKIIPGSEQVEWTAFKTTKKIGVIGHFSGVEFTHKDKALTIQDLFESTSFAIKTKMLQTGDQLRDIKIAKYFFGHMLGDGNITGSVNKFLSSVDKGPGMARATIEMNQNKRGVVFQIEQDRDTFTFKSTIQLSNFKLGTAVAKLNKACHALHLGTDNISKIWDDVDLKVGAKVTRVCLKE